MTVVPVLARLGALGLLLALVLTPQSFAPVFRGLTENGAPPIYTQTSLLDLTLAHLTLVFAASLVSAVLALAVGIFVTRPVGAAFLPLSRALVNIGQVFPPVAVLAIAVPLVGFGTTPTLIALVLYGLLPVFETTITGLREVDPVVVEAARGMGLGARQRLWGVELPLALPLILTGLRLTLVINMGTATIGSTVAAKGLGEVIIAGLQSSNTAFILQGGLIVALLAVLIYDGMTLLEGALTGHESRD
ncbi:ABC transporter permease [Lichenihabitans sp. Uapishka_5]|uniref:ABC transporter permease n=1 Tax=Lichenihabitans sp. Uapishka_5 TaxID=3037302 RepID=UPI0029E7EDA1|nr:ABC transporter permease [Lichenihabitans sp. Uapishka_5]MDX7949587.1 ABC transporter permease [Lichenihabitans sp. Uapishka_5]